MGVGNMYAGQAANNQGIASIEDLGATTDNGYTRGMVHVHLPFVISGSNTKNASLSSAQPLTAPAGARKLLIQAFAQNVRYTLDGATAPAATVGFQIKAGDAPVIIPVVGGQVVKVIEESASAYINYQWGS